MEITPSGFSSSQESPFVYVPLSTDSMFTFVTPSGYSYSELSGATLFSMVSTRHIPRKGQIFPQGIS